MQVGGMMLGGAESVHTCCALKKLRSVTIKVSSFTTGQLGEALTDMLVWPGRG